MSDLEDDDEILDEIKIKTQLTLRSSDPVPLPPRTPDPMLRSSDHLSPSDGPSTSTDRTRQTTGADIALDNSFETIDLNMDTQILTPGSCGHVTCTSHTQEPCITNL